jgi:peptide/nickel transport system substrate-binding protein
MVADNAPAQKRVAEVTLSGLQKLGFKVSFQAVTRDTMYSKFCGVPTAKVAICPSVAWLKDFADAQTMLDPTFNGKNIVAINNSNWPQLDNPKVNAAMDKAETIVGEDDRAKAWADIDRTVTGLAPGAIWLWDKPTSLKSDNVNDVIGKASANPEIAFMSLK